MRAAFSRVAVWTVLAAAVQAQVEPVTVRVPRPEAWTGQRIAVFVELRAPGSFAGTATFELPQVSGSLFLKVGNPVVSSETIEDTSWFVQTHEFALYSQRTGALELEPFPVRFEHREGFVGPVQEVRAEVPGLRVDVRRPPQSESIGFLVTTESFEVSQAWNPQPGPVQAGATIVRELVQRAEDVSGMALAPAPTSAPSGVRVYPGSASTEDRLQRGEFLGERRESITYLLTEPGTVTLPALRYVWWDPGSESLESVTLPAAVLEVSPAPVAALPGGEPGGAGRPWPVLAVLAGALFAWHARRVVGWVRRLHLALNPPERAAARRLLQACRRGDPGPAQDAWNAWVRTRTDDADLTPELRSAAVELQRRRYGPRTAAGWNGAELARALLAFRARVQVRRMGSTDLPALNP